MRRPIPLLLFFVAACLERTPAVPPPDGGSAPRTDAGLVRRPDGGAMVGGDGGPTDGGASTDGGGEPDGGVDEVCLRRPETLMTFLLDVGVIAQDVILEGAVLSVDRDALVIDAGDAGVHTLTWRLPSLADPPLEPGRAIRLLYRPYSLSTVQSASILIRDVATGQLLFVGDTGLHRTRFTEDEIEVCKLGVADRGCKLFPVRCFEPTNLDLVVTLETGASMKVLLGEKASFSYRGNPYEVIHVNVANLPFLNCDVIPARFRSYVIQRVGVPR